MVFSRSPIRPTVRTVLVFAILCVILFQLKLRHHREPYEHVCSQGLPHKSMTITHDNQANSPINGISEEDLQELRVKNYQGEGNDTALYYFIPRPYKVNSHSNTFIFDGNQICESQNLYILVIVPSVIAHVQRRKAIRSTWARPSISRRWLDGTPLTNVKVLFLFGETDNLQKDHEILQKENQLYGDIVQARFHDSYRNLTRKMITALCWVQTYCPTAAYVLKADEDTFVHLPNMIKLIQKLNSTDSFIGMRIEGFVPPVLRTGRWAVAYEQYPMQEFPSYIVGNFYAFSTKIVSKLCYLSEYFPFVPIEDAFVTGILRKALGARLDEIGIDCFSLSTCNFTKGDKAAVSNLNESDMYDIWNSLNNKSASLSS